MGMFRSRGPSSAAIVILLATVAEAQDQAGTTLAEPKPKATSTATTRPPAIPDPDWIPKEGDKAEIVVPDTPACVDRGAFQDLAKFLKAGDRVGVDRLLGAKDVVKVPRGVSVLILRRFRPERSTTVGRSYSPAEYAQLLQNKALAPQDETNYPLEVRILDGDLGGSVRFVPEACVARMIPIPTQARKPRKIVRPPAPTKPADPAAKAETALGMARGLEKAKKPAAALKYYRQVLKDYPGSPQAKTAQERIKTLEGTK